MSKDQKLNFIKNFSKIKISSICDELNINKSNLWRGITSSQNVDLVYINLLEKLKSIVDDAKKNL